MNAPHFTSTPTALGSLPLVGHAHHLARTPLPFIASLRERGSVVRIRIGTAPAYVVTDPALTRKVLVTDAADFTKGGKIIDALRVFFGDGLATVADGDTHLRNRRLMQPMFNKAHIATRGDAMIDQVQTMVAAWEDGEQRDVFADMNDLTLAAFLVALFGTDLPTHLQSEFTALMPAIMKGTIRQTLLPAWASRLPLPANRAHAARVARLRALIDQAIDHHAGPTTGPTTGPAPAQAPGCPHAARPAGLFETLLTAPEPLSRQQLQDEAITLLTGAIETTGTTLAWTLYEISQHAHIEQRLRAELASVCQGRRLRYDDVDRLDYARRVLQEAVRKYGPAWMVTRTATRDTDLGGHSIPAGADVVWSPYLHQHDPEVFSDPDRFDPDRWTAGAASATRGSFLAFGDGRRKCIGENFAWAELQIILATILQNCSHLELTSRPPRAQAVVTVKPDRLTLSYGRHTHAGHGPADGQSHRPPTTSQNAS
ncbi:cytochrome P450 [Streptomyces pactum]|uniref:Cytochrome P450 n=1 Tax=Streptomyces pactum TaxID=68249 RepID=A0A1S6JIE4_9ACTN|nr:cytochrome P450 [Streptomyces pactum]AQS71525.1 cytochrome P450 [Streptomyces pactum]